MKDGLGIIYAVIDKRFYDPEIGRFLTLDSASYLEVQSLTGLNLFAYYNDNPVNYETRYKELSSTFFAKGHQGNMRSSKYTYWSIEQLLHRLKELSRKGHLTPEKKENREIETELKARVERNRAKRKGYAHSHFSFDSNTTTGFTTPINYVDDIGFEYIPNIRIDEKVLVTSAAVVGVGGLIAFIIANDATGIGVCDDLALLVLIPLFIIIGGKL